MEIQFLLFFLSWSYPTGTGGQCTSPKINDYFSGDKGGQSSITTSFENECLPTDSADRFFYQKKISGRWVDLFECTASDQEGFALDSEFDYNLHDRASGRITASKTGHVLTIQDSLACESGNWRFTIIKSGDTLNSHNITLDIDDIPTETDISVETPADTTLLANRSLPFSCTINKARPQPEIKWSFNGDIETGSADDTPIECGGGVWSIHNVVNKNFDMLGNVDVKCLLNELGIESKVKSVNISAPPAFAEEISVTPKQPAADEAFTINCTASGTNVGLSWTLNDAPIDKSYFEEPMITQVDYQGLDFGQTKATVISLKSKQIDFPTSETISKQSGQFKCVATVLSETVSLVKTLYLGYRPIGEDDHESHRKLKKGQATLECNVTAYPEPVYMWHKYDEQLPYSTWNLDIVVTDDCNYTCTATNTLGETMLYFIVSVETSDGLTGGIIAVIVIAVIACFALIIGVLGFLYKKKQQKKDEEVVAYADSSNSGANSPNKNNGVNAITTVPAVYAEVNKDKTKKNREEPAAAVYTQVRKPGRPLPKLKPKSGSTNTGPVYSEVNKPKQGRLTPIENQSRGDSGKEYEEMGGKPLPPIQNTRHYDSTVQSNEHGGLHYADVDFLRQGNGGTKQSHGTKNPSYEPTEYAQIDHRKSAGIVV